MSCLDEVWLRYEGKQRGQLTEEPVWMKTEKEHFNYLDKNQDGKLNREEVASWVMPEDLDHAAADADHLIYGADTNKVWEA